MFQLILKNMPPTHLLLDWLDEWNWDGFICEGFRQVVRSELALRNKLIIWRGNQGKDIPALGKNNDKIIGAIMFEVLEKRKEPGEGLCLSLPTPSFVSK